MSSSSPPPEYLIPCLNSIEQAVVVVYREHPRLKDKEVEEIYNQFKHFYQQLAKGKEVYEPDSTIAARQALIEAILNGLDARVELGFDDHLVDKDEIQPGGRPISNVEAAYAMCFNILRSSVRFWRKELGPKGYLKFITGQFDQMGG